LCATKPQLAACDGKAEGEGCTFDEAPGECTGGACVPVVCGDGKVGLGEVCDDGDTTSGNGCSADCLSKETCGNGIVDPIRLGPMLAALPNEQCDDGNLVSGDGCSSNCKLETPRWSLVDAPLAQRALFATTYDSGRGRTVLFGGYDVGYYSDIYDWTGKTWVRASPPISPQPRGNAMLAYDPTRHRVVLFGGTPGSSTNAFGDTWEWDGERWTEILPMAAPHSRAYGAMVYDPSRKKIVLFGGWTGANALADLWEWDGKNWTQTTPTGTPPAGRAGHLMGYDPVKGRIVIAGGNDGTSPILDTWELKNGAWKQLATNGPAELVGGNASFDSLSSMAYDRAGARFIAYARTNVGASKTLGFDGTSWSDLGSSPANLNGMGVFADGKTGTVYMFGGYDPTSGTLATTMYSWSGSGWTPLQAPFRPGLWTLSASASDPEHGRGWVYGGLNASNQAVAELASFDGSSWTKYNATGPVARYGPHVAYDRKHSRLVVFGGKPDSGPALGDTWLFDGTTWSAPTLSMSPPARFGGVMVYDTKREKVVLFGGYDGTTEYQDTWEWDGTKWSKVTTAHAPDPRVLAMATFDATRGITLLANGFDAMTMKIFNDGWSYDGTDWKLALSPLPLVSRVFTFALAFDAVAAADVMFGGVAAGGIALDDTWAWNGDWHQLVLESSPTARGNATAFQAPNGAGIMMHGGSLDVDSGGTFDETWRLRYERDEPRENCFVPVDNDGDGLVGCADPDCWYVCTPACPPGAPCDASAPKCGDGTCSAVENCRMCPSDCTCTAVCGDGFCDTGETQTSCPGDCTP